MAVARRGARGISLSTYVWWLKPNQLINPLPNLTTNPHTITQRCSGQPIYVDYAGTRGYCDGTFRGARRGGRNGAPRSAFPYCG